MQHTSARQSSTSYQGNEPQESSVSTTVMIEGPSYGFGNRKFRPQIPRSNKTLRTQPENVATLSRLGQQAIPLQSLQESADEIASSRASISLRALSQRTQTPRNSSPQQARGARERHE